MKLEDFWKHYVGEETPLVFMERHGGGNPPDCVARYLDGRGHVFGLMRRSSWRETFESDPQHKRHEVACALETYLECNREEWEGQLSAAPAAEAVPPETEAEPTNPAPAEAEPETAPQDNGPGPGAGEEEAPAS